jgi:hypothetical protein
MHAREHFLRCSKVESSFGQRFFALGRIKGDQPRLYWSYVYSRAQRGLINRKMAPFADYRDRNYWRVNGQII